VYTPEVCAKAAGKIIRVYDPRYGLNGVCKRCFDIFLAVFGLIVSSPAIGLISLLLWLESPGRVIFSQARIGLHGKRFRMHKFRKFPVDWGDRGPGVTVTGDSRMTFIGALLEKLKFDELPQLWNILKGEMSFVGPRPEIVRFADLFEGKYASLLDHVPGVFGPNQVAFRNEGEMYPADESPESYYRGVLFPRKAEADLAYFKRANWLTDIFWIVRGVWVSIVWAVNWRRFFKLHAILIAADALIVMISWTIANLLRFSGWPDEANLDCFLMGAYAFPGFMVFVMYAGGCYQQPMRYFSLSDSVRLILSATMAWLVGFLAILAQKRGASVYLIPMGWFIVVPMLMAPRFLVRLRWQRLQNGGAPPPKRVAMYGAGRVGNALASWMSNGALVGFIDDDPELKGRRVAGRLVLGHECDIPTVHEVHGFDELWVTFKPDSLKRTRLYGICKQRKIELVVISELEPFVRFIRLCGPPQ
jgi:lipopolysaccharide/colanic/teichoic acid biosynthesis glycosyltransferase